MARAGRSIENRRAPRHAIDGLQLSWATPDARSRRSRRPRPARGLDVSEVGLAVRARREPQFAPAARVTLWCGVHEFTAVVRRCEPITEEEFRYGLELVEVADATIRKLLFYAASAPRRQLERSWGAGDT
jgi:hypothetical protein